METMVRSLIFFSTLIMGSAVIAQAQHSSPSGDVALTYQWTHTNTQPGDCGCFGLNGGGLAASIKLEPRLSIVADVSGGHESNGPGTGDSLTLIGYTGGVRGYFYPYRPAGRHRLQPFAQLLAGVAHAGGGIAGAGDGTYAFALRAGGGLDVPLNRSFSIRAVQAEYYLTDFKNETNNHQNNFLVGAGVVFHF